MFILKAKLYQYPPFFQPQMMNPSYLHQPQEMFLGSGVGYSAYAQLPHTPPHLPTGFIPQQSYIPMQLPFHGANGEPLPQHSFGLPYSHGTTYYPPPVASTARVLPQQSSTSAKSSRGSTPVADYDGQRPPSVPVTIAESKFDRSASVPVPVNEEIEESVNDEKEDVEIDDEDTVSTEQTPENDDPSLKNDQFHPCGTPPSVDTLGAFCFIGRKKKN